MHIRFANIRHILTMSVAFVVGALAGYGVASLLEKTYRSVVAATVIQGGDAGSLLSGLGSQLGGLGSLVGLNLSGGKDTGAAMALIRSRSLSDKFVAEAGVMDALCKRELIKCLADYRTDVAASAITLRRASKYFSEHILSIQQDDRLQILNVSITWFDREAAMQWANGFVATADSELRRAAIADAQSRKAYLEKVAQETSVLGVQQAIYRVLETQINAEMMASTRSEYAFHIVDAAVVADPSVTVRPKRAVIALVSGLLAMGGAMLFGRGKPKSAAPA